MTGLPRWDQLQARKRARNTRDRVAQAMDRPVTGAVHLRPNGDHWIKIEVNGLSVLIHIGQMARLEALFAEARAEIDADGHRSQDRLHISVQKLGVH